MMSGTGSYMSSRWATVPLFRPHLRPRPASRTAQLRSTPESLLLATFISACNYLRIQYDTKHPLALCFYLLCRYARLLEP